MILTNNLIPECYKKKIVDVKFFKEYYNVRKFYGENDKIYFNNTVDNILDKFDINLSEGDFKNLESKSIKSLLYKIAVYTELFELGYKPNKIKEYEDSDESEESDEPDNLNKSEQSDEPDNSDKPDKSDEPDNSDKTDNSDKPDKPDEPDKKDEPDNTIESDEDSDDSDDNEIEKVKSKKCINCKKLPAKYNLCTEKVLLYCKKCRKKNMVNIKNTRCITSICFKKAKHDNKYCTKCYYFHNPDKAPKCIKFKENEVYKFLKENFKDIEILYNKQVKGDGKCLNVRPDFFINFEHHSLMIECDENQHKSYDKECIKNRIYIIQSFLNRSLIVIQFNPDKYVNENNAVIKSCFDIDKKLCLTTIPEENIVHWNNRLMILKKTIESNMTYDTHNEPIKIIKLFYDNEKLLEDTIPVNDTKKCEYCDNVFDTHIIKMNHSKICRIHFYKIDRKAFGNENLKYISRTRIYILSMHCIEKGFLGFKNYINEVFLNKNKPENNTIRKHTEKFTEYFNGKKWCIESDIKFFNKLMKELRKKISKCLIDNNYKYVKKSDISDFMLSFDVSANYNIENFQIEKSDKDSVQINFFKALLDEIREKSEEFIYLPYKSYKLSS
jgi:hypothetical protein